MSAVPSGSGSRAAWVPAIAAPTGSVVTLPFSAALGPTGYELLARQLAER